MGIHSSIRNNHDIMCLLLQDRCSHGGLAQYKGLVCSLCWGGWGGGGEWQLCNANKIKIDQILIEVNKNEDEYCMVYNWQRSIK